MTQELIINGQHVDTGDINIVLEYVTNLFGDIGKINLSRSYTIQIPKTRRNAQVLDDPGAPAHNSGMTRRYFSARYYRNGIDLLGDARAYLLRTTEDAYEVALVWSTMDGLQELSQSKATINDLAGLPILTWIGPNGRTPDYTGGNNADGAVFAWYNAGLNAIQNPTETNAATHPSMKVSALFDMILTQAGIPYLIHSEAAANAMAGQVILAAPSRKPTEAMDETTGTSYDYAFTTPGDATLRLDNNYRTDGWDPVMDSYYNIAIGGEAKHRIQLNLAAPSATLEDFAGIDLIVKGYASDDSDITGVELARVKFKDGAYLYDQEIDVSGFGLYILTFSTSDLPDAVFTAHDPERPLVRLYKPHEEIHIADDNRFPIEGNLPDIGQWDFIKTCMALYGLVPVIQDGVLALYGYDDMLDLANAYDWTSKVDMTTDGGPRGMAYSMDGWAKANDITFEENKAGLPFDPTMRVEVDDETLDEQRDWFALPFAASTGSTAVHYQTNDDGETESTDLEPRIFSMGLGLNGGMQLYYTDDMHGGGMKAAYYTKVESTMRRPVYIEADIRLHEIDIAQLDLTRPVYLAQFGGYYAILKIQTSATDLCKVELLQIA